MPQQTHDTLPPLSSQLQALIQLGSWPLRCPKRPPSEHEPRNARRRKSKQRQLKEETLFLCGWLLLFSSLPPSQWTDEQVLALYRARWQVELVIKRMKQVLRLAQLRGQTASTNEATILALLLAWALLQEEVQHARQVLTEAVEQWALSLCTPGICEPRPAGCLPTVSSWTTTALGGRPCVCSSKGTGPLPASATVCRTCNTSSAVADANATIRRAPSLVYSLPIRH